jgi:ribosomal protein S18 acetylase RimI-like enzyme
VSDLVFRAARPEDAARVVPLMYDAARSLNDYLLAFAGARPEAFLERDFRRGGGVFGHSQQVVAARPGGEVVGTATVYPGGASGRLMRGTLASLWLHYGPWRALVVAGRSLPLARLFASPRPDRLFVANCGVDPACRGQGVFTALHAHLVERARTAGLRALELDVSFGNVRAQALYERLGYRTESERPYRGRRPLDGFRRMRLDLP